MSKEHEVFLVGVHALVCLARIARQSPSPCAGTRCSKTKLSPRGRAAAFSSSLRTIQTRRGGTLKIFPQQRGCHGGQLLPVMGDKLRVAHPVHAVV